MGKTRWAAVAAGCGAVVFGLAWLSFQDPHPERYPVRGIDVSHHQGAVDWPRVKEAGVAFVFLKASEGGDFRDRRFRQNWAAVRQAGIPAGAYHFFTFCKPGKAQAENFLDATAGAAGASLPPAVDLEFVGNCGARPSLEELRREVADFEKRLGRRPVYYVTTSFMRRYAGAVPPGSEIWVRSVYLHPRTTLGRPWVFWQYTDRGRIDGVKGPVDLNVFNGSRAKWEAYIGRWER